MAKGTSGTVEDRRAYYDSLELKCPYCVYEKGGDRDKWKIGLPLAFRDKTEFLKHYNNTHPKKSNEIRYLFTEDELVVCPVCNNFMCQITDRHLKLHNMTYKDLKEKYPEVKMRPTKLKKVWSERCERVNRTKKMRKMVSKSLKAGFASGKYDEIKKQVSATKKRKFASGEIVVWNKGLTKETSPSLVSTGNKIREYYLNGDFLKHCKIKGYFHSDKNNKDFPYRSTYELKAFEILEADNKVFKYEYETLRIRYYGKDNRKHAYRPDLFVNDSRIIEVKSNWIFEKQNTSDDDTVFRKFRAAKRFAKKHGYTFEVWTEKELGLVKDS
jgi:hypothetical protein